MIKYANFGIDFKEVTLFVLKECRGDCLFPFIYSSLKNIKHVF